MVINGAKMTENGSTIMAEIITILTDKNVSKQNFATR